MPSPDGSFNLSGRVYGGSATSIGNLMVADGTGFYVIATAANRATFGRAQAIATSNWGGAQSGTVSLQFVGTCDSNLPNVGVGAAGRWVRCSTAGAFEVFTPTNGGSSDVVGCANAAGVVTMLFGVLTETMLVAAGTPPGGASGAVQVNNAGAFAGVSPGSNGQVLTVVSGAWASAPSSGGGTTPTGTGLRKVVAGVENAAASLIVDADVSGTAAIAGTKVSPNFGAQTVTTTGPGRFGTTPAATGDVQLPFQGLIKGRDSTNTVDVVGLQVGDTPIIGDSLNGTGVILRCFSGGAITSQLGGVDKFVSTNASNNSSVPLLGMAVAWGSVNGIGTQAMADANQTPAAAVYQLSGIKTTGALTANRDLTLPTATDAQGYAKWINNTCTGAFSVNVRCTAGTQVLVANGKSASVWIDSRGVTRMTADV